MKPQRTSAAVVHWLCAGSALLLSQASHAQLPPVGPPRAASQAVIEPEQRLRQQLEARERAHAAGSPRGRASWWAPAAYPTLPAETPCFHIDDFVLDVPGDLPAAEQRQGASGLPQDRFAFARTWLDHYQGSCIGKRGVDTLTKGVAQAILDHGYVTSRVLVPEQNLTTGTLRLTLIPGVIGDIRFAELGLWGTWKSAFPTRGGDLLDLRDLEQGLEQMKRLSSQDVDMQVVPTATPGVSDVVIAVKRSRRWTMVAAIDDSGSRSTGKRQGNVSLAVDNPLGLNGLFNVGYSQDLELDDKARGTRGWSAFYSIPWGYWTATLSAYGSDYFQQVAGANQAFVFSGQSQSVDLKVQRVVRRTRSNVLGLQWRLSRRFGKSFIEDTELAQQRRNHTIAEIGITDRHDFGAAQLDASLLYRQGIGGLGSQADTLAADGGPTWRFRMAVADLNVSVPIKLGQRPLRYLTSFRGQFTNDRLYFVDAITIGSRHTVRGFDGESMLAGDSGFYWRNELQVPVANSRQAIYAGIDYGRVFGPSTVALVGRRLAGAVMGLRGGFGTGLGAISYDVLIGTPVYKPAAFHTAGVTGGFQLVYQY